MVLELFAAVALATSRPHCQHAVVEQNSGAGPNTPVLVCNALLPSGGEGWQLIVDGGPLQPGAVVFGFIDP